MKDDTGVRTFSMNGDDGGPVEVGIPARLRLEVPAGALDDRQAELVERVFAEGSPRTLDRDEWDAIRDLRATVKGVPDSTALIVRFDWKWVRIDEKSLGYEEMLALEARQ